MNLKIFSEEFKEFQDLPKRGLFVNKHGGFVKVSPAEYTKPYVGANGSTISKKRVYEAILEAATEAKEKKLAKLNLPLGYDTHDIVYIGEKFSETSSFKQIVMLDLSTSSIKLDAFEKLKNEYNLDHFELGRFPFINQKVSNALKEITSFPGMHSRVSSVFYRKRDNHPRVYVTSAFNELHFGVRSAPNIHLDDELIERHHVKLESSNPDFEL